MTDAKESGRMVFSRRGMLQMSGAAAAAAIGAPLATLRIPVAGAQESVDITIWNNHPEWQDPLTELLNAFTAAIPGVSIELTAIPGQDYRPKLATALQSETPSDVLGLNDGDLVGVYKNGPDTPCIDLTGVVDVSTLIDSARGQVEIDGVVWGVPLASYTVGLAMQNPVMADAGLTAPTTWDELKTVCQALLDQGITPLAFGGKDEIHSFFMYSGLVSSVLGPAGFDEVRTGARKLTDADAVAAAQMLKDLQPFLNEGFEATDYVTAKALFAQQQAAMMVAGTADFTGFVQENPDADLAFVAWPGPEAGKYATNTGMELLYTVSKFSSPERQEAATKFVQWLATKDAQQIVADTIALPISKEVTELKDPIKAGTVAVRDQDVTVWYSLPESAGTYTAVTENFGGFWAGDLTPEAFAEAIQASIVPSGA